MPCIRPCAIAVHSHALQIEEPHHKESSKIIDLTKPRSRDTNHDGEDSAPPFLPPGAHSTPRLIMMALAISDTVEIINLIETNAGLYVSEMDHAYHQWQFKQSWSVENVLS